MYQLTFVDSSSDAYAAVQLYAILDHDRQRLDDVPPLPYHAELNLPIPVVLPAAKADQEVNAEEPTVEDVSKHAEGHGEGLAEESSAELAVDDSEDLARIDGGDHAEVNAIDDAATKD